MTLTHASWFSGVGGLDMGLEAAGWETVSFSEIDPYASAVLAHRWPGVPNLGSIVDVARGIREPAGRAPADGVRAPADDGWREAGAGLPHGTADAFLWTGGFPCQDLSVAGKRRGIVEGSRSGLAITFLDLVERHRPPAIILENVPGLLSSHKGRDFGALLGRLGELGYWWAYRVLDARYFGVPQRRRRVFIVALHAGIGATADSPAEVLSVGSRCDRHPATGGQAGPGVAAGTHVGTLDTSLGHHGGAWGDQAVAAGHVVAHERAGDNGRPRADADQRVQREPGRDAGTASDGWLVGAEADSGRMREAPGLARRMDGRAGMDSQLLPDGLDSHRYRCCGNGVVAPVAEFVGERLRVVVERLLARPVYTIADAHQDIMRAERSA